MKLVPERTAGAKLTLGPTEANIDFTVDFKDEIPAHTAIASYLVTAELLGPGTDVTETFVVQTSQLGTQVTAVVGDGTQHLGQVYRLHVSVTLDNDPPSTLAGYFDLQITD